MAKCMSHKNAPINTLLLQLVLRLVFLFDVNAARYNIERNERIQNLPSDGGGGQRRGETNKQANRDRYHFI